MTNTKTGSDEPSGLWSITGLDAKSIAALIITAIIQVNTVLAGFGVTPVSVDEQGVYTAVSVIVSLINVAYTIWHNFNFTKAAKAGQLVTDRIKTGSLTSLTGIIGVDAPAGKDGADSVSGDGGAR